MKIFRLTALKAPFRGLGVILRISIFLNHFYLMLILTTPELQFSRTDITCRQLAAGGGIAKARTRAKRCYSALLFGRVAPPLVANCSLSAGIVTMFSFFFIFYREFIFKKLLSFSLSIKKMVVLLQCDFA